MTISVKQPHNISVATPRQLDVHKFAESRAAELKALHSTVANRLDNDFCSRRNKRRRTNSFDNRVAKGRFRKKRKVEGLVNHEGESLENDEKKGGAPRRVRRRTELRQNPLTGFSSSGDGTKRLRTHVWHAKRFKMAKLWGVHLPLHVQGSGRGSRSILKKCKHGVLVHDASYYSAVELEGPEDILLTILNSLLVPCPSSDSEATSKIMHGLMYKDAMLHCGGSTNPQTIAPVTYMWKPEPSCNNQEMAEKNVLCRKVWVWLHPAALREGHDVLKQACETQIKLNGQSVTCISLEDHLGKIELIGSHSFEHLQTILHPTTSSPENSGLSNNHSVGEFDAGTSEGTPFFGIEDKINISTISTLTVKDPRMSSKEATDVCEAKRSSSCDHKQYNLCKNANIWDANLGISPPEEETLLCHERNCQRMQSYRVFDKTSSKRNASDKGHCSRLCPIMLLKNHANRGSIKGWSIILPLSWIKAFWVPLVSHGGHAIGLREKHWIACDVGLPIFPSDFPDCTAYSTFMALKASISDEEEGLRPPSMRSSRVPVPPPWSCVRLAFGTTESNDTQNHSEDIGTSRDESSMRLLDTKISDITPAESHDSILGGFVARTSNSLNNFLNNINGTQLLLFPKVPDVNKCLYKCVRDEKILELPVGSVSQISSSQRLCFVRVLLHVYKEGVFEEGAVICAPHASDILSWSIRSGEDNHVQVPQSFLSSCFVQQPSGEWELEIPRDASIIESFRWPIGFVTTGFVRGSKRPAALALCEATLLARLREEQWRAVRTRQRRREIYVLVRNLRSTAYRLALATIILEEQEEDVECM